MPMPTLWARSDHLGVSATTVKLASCTLPYWHKITYAKSDSSIDRSDQSDTYSSSKTNYAIAYDPAEEHDVKK
ncbi:hypothetical protein CEP53_010760 [Fusarium sp. AF-6]|nr:hypothetical protein CEP53_010760 [Fusarium sp. AF-6]